MLRPLVQEAHKPIRWLGAFGAYATGALMSSIALGIALGLLGAMLFPRQWAPGAMVVVALIGVTLALCDWGVKGTRTPTLRRQTQPLWRHTLGPVGAMFLWGLDLGLGFTTIRVASLYWVVALVVLVNASPPMGAIVFGAYGGALVLNMGVGTLILERRRYPLTSTACILRLARLIRGGLAVALVVWSVVLLVVTLR